MRFLGSRQRLRRLWIVCVFGLSVFASSAFGATPADNTNSVWVLAKKGGIIKLAQSDASLLSVTDDITGKSIALAIDNKRFVIWLITANRQLHAINVIDGKRQFSVPLPPQSSKQGHDHHGDKHDDDDDDLEHVQLVVNETDGSVWIVEKKGIYKYTASGSLSVSERLRHKARAVSFDDALQRLWIATKKSLITFDANGVQQLYIPLPRKAEVESITLDTFDQSLWVATEKRLYRYDSLGGLVFSKDLRELGRKIKHPEDIAADGKGNLWVAAKRELIRINRAGTVINRLTPLTKKRHHNRSSHGKKKKGDDDDDDDDHKDGEGVEIKAMAVNTDDQSVWVIGKEQGAHIDSTGTLVAEFAWEHKLRGIALSFDRTLPVINITSPAAGASVTSQNAFMLTYNDQGSGIDVSTIAFTVNGQAMGFACTETATGSTCVPNSAFGETYLTISVTIKDLARNTSMPATINVKLDSDGDGYADEIDAFPSDPTEWSDLDGDGIGDNSDPDKDGDGYENGIDAFPEDSTEWKDTDTDGIGDNSDPDIDGDGYNNGEDAFPTDPGEWLDTDGDGIGNGTDPDIDNDGAANGVDAFPLDPTEQADLDGDGIGNNADTDRDGDGVNNDDDVFPDDENRWKLPVVKITDPASLITVGASPINLTGTIDDTSATITVNGTLVANNAGQFATQVALTEGHNTVVARAVDDKGSEATASIVVTLDATPPHVTIQSPLEGETLTNSRITVMGLVNDIVRGTVAEDQANVLVNGIAATVSNRSYLAKDVPLTAGANTITVVASDKVGNTETTSITVNYTPITGAKVLLSSGSGQTANILQTVPNSLIAKVVNANGTPAVNKEVIFRVIQGDGKVGAGTAADQRGFAATTDTQGLATTKFTLGSRAGQGNHRVRATAVGFNGEAIFHASANPNPGNKISIQSGNNQRGAILSPLPAPLVVSVTDVGGNAVPGSAVKFSIAKGEGAFGNGQVTQDITTDSDGRASVTFTVGRDAGMDTYRLNASLVGTLASAGFTASALIPGDPGQTSVTGVVMNNQDAPLPNVTIRVENTNREAVTDGNGIFKITEVPVGPLRLLVEGQTTTVAGDWPTLSYDVVTVAGASNTLPAPIYLVPLNTKSAKIVGNEDVTLTLDEVPGFALTVKAGSVTFPDGSKAGKMSVTTVNSSKVPMPPPNGMQPQFIVTIQPAGAKFDPPAQLQLPNVDGHAPGAEVEMYSYDHDLEDFVTIGWGTVTNDGKEIRSNIGVGVIKAGWHCGSQPQGGGCTHQCKSECEVCDSNCVCQAKVAELTAKSITPASDQTHNFLSRPGIALSANLSPAKVDDLLNIVWTVVSKHKEVKADTFSPESKKGTTLGFIQKNSHPSYLPLTRGSRSASDPVEYLVTAKWCAHQKEIVLKQDVINTIRQEYVNHNIRVPSRDSVKPTIGNDFYSANLINSSSNYKYSVGDSAQVALNVRNTYNAAICTRFGLNNCNFHLQLNSAWRNPERNEKIGGVLSSNHQYGGAVDLRVEATTAEALGIPMTGENGLWCLLQGLGGIAEITPDGGGYEPAECSHPRVTRVHFSE